MTNAESTERVAFCGLGLMGGGMARRLLRAGYPVTVYNRSADKTELLAMEGANVARTPRAAAADADVVFSMVADDNASRDVWLGDDGALAAVRAGMVLVESSTLTTSWIRELAAAASDKGCDLLDAPVTGSKPQAAAGELRFLVGGSADVLNRVRGMLTAMGRDVVHVGPAGSGALLKLINNFLCGVQAASLAQALVLAERASLDWETAAQVLANGAPGSPLVKGMLPRMTQHDYAPNFHLALMAKDLSYALQEADRCGVTLSTARAALDAYERALEGGHGHDDVVAVVEAVRAGT